MILLPIRGVNGRDDRDMCRTQNERKKNVQLTLWKAKHITTPFNANVNGNTIFPGRNSFRWENVGQIACVCGCIMKMFHAPTAKAAWIAFYGAMCESFPRLWRTICICHHLNGTYFYDIIRSNGGWWPDDGDGGGGGDGVVSPSSHWCSSIFRRK